MKNKVDIPQKGLYIHVPFCVSKCKYCDFNSWPITDFDEVDDYMEALLGQLKLHHTNEQISETEFDTLYIGGGTPTCLSAYWLEYLFELLFDYVSLKPSAEITIEINPNTISSEKIEVLSKNVNRVSIGLQSSHDKLLTVLGRAHSYLEFKKTYEALMRQGFDNINVDLIYGIPGQSFQEFDRDLTTVINLNPAHISLYNLTFEEDTPLYRELKQGVHTPVEEQTEVTMYHRAREKLKDCGFEHYELANFAKPGYYSRHNLIYWFRNDYLGIGPGAHSLWNERRFATESDLLCYKQGAVTANPFVEFTRVDKEEALSERLFLGLRLIEGVDLNEISQDFQLDVKEKYSEIIYELISKGLLTKTKDNLRLTPDGYMLSNLVFMEFLPCLDK